MPSCTKVGVMSVAEQLELDRIGPFSIVERLRVGGMAELYLAKRSGVAGFQRPVAIKIMRERFANEAHMRQMFIDEALLGSNLHHPNIVQVEEFGEHAGNYYIAMEYIAGCSLLELARYCFKTEQPLGTELVANIVMQVARGLHHAHRTMNAEGELLGVVHRDISPGNILVSRDGHVKLIDFGIASSGFRAEHTVGSLKGKFRYLSPEQARGETLTPSTDIYSLGLVLWEVLAGRRALRGDSQLALLEFARDPKVPPLLDVVPGILPALSKVVEKAMAPNKAERFGSARAFADAIAEAVPGVSMVQPDELGRWVREVPTGGPDRVSLASGSGSLDQLAASSSVSFDLHEDSEPEADSMRVALETSGTQLRASVEQSPRRGLLVAALLFVGGALGGLGYVYTAAPAEERAPTVVSEPLPDTEPVAVPAPVREPEPVQVAVEEPDPVEEVEPEPVRPSPRTRGAARMGWMRRAPRAPAPAPRVAEPAQPRPAEPPARPAEPRMVEPSAPERHIDGTSGARVRAGGVLLAE